MDSKESPAEEAVGQLKDGIPLSRTSALVMISNTPKGRGVFANEHIPRNTVLEVCPVLVLPPADNELHVSKTVLYHYNWPYQPPGQQKPITTQAVILGLGSLFNHSTYGQNVGWTRDLDNGLVTYKALRDIKQGEECCISYGDRLTFVDADSKAIHEKLEEREEDVLGKIDLF